MAHRRPRSEGSKKNPQSISSLRSVLLRSVSVCPRSRCDTEFVANQIRKHYFTNGICAVKCPFVCVCGSTRIRRAACQTSQPGLWCVRVKQWAGQLKQSDEQHSHLQPLQLQRKSRPNFLQSNFGFTIELISVPPQENEISLVMKCDDLRPDSIHTTTFFKPSSLHRK